MITDKRFWVTCEASTNPDYSPLERVFQSMTTVPISKCREIPLGDVPYHIYSWKVNNHEFRLLQNNKGSVLSMRCPTGLFWVIVEDPDHYIPAITLSELTGIKWYFTDSSFEYGLDNISEDHIMKYESDNGGIYNLNLKDVTCTCNDFRHRRKHHTIDKEDRQCKHLKLAYLTYPDFLPESILEADSDKPSIQSDGKTRYPRFIFDAYVRDIKATLKNAFGNQIEQFEICGSYRRLAPNVSDLDVLIATKPDADWDGILDYFEQYLKYQLCDNIGRGDKKAGYTVDGFIRVDFKRVTIEEFPFALLHFTGSKATNIDMRRRANSMHMKLNEYGLFNEDTGEMIPCSSERDIFERLQLPYKEPWDR